MFFHIYSINSSSLQQDSLYQENERISLLLLVFYFLTYSLINKKEAKLLRVATSDNVLNIPKQYRDLLRANILKNMLLNLA